MDYAGESNRLAIFVASCDAYSDAWEAFFTLFFKYWPDCPFPIYLVAETKKYNDARVKSMTYDDANWGTRVKWALKNIPEKNVLYLQEDYFLMHPVKTEEILKLFEIFKKENAACLRLYPVPKPDMPMKDYKGIGAIKIGAPYRLSLQAAIWDKEIFESLLVNGGDPWESELVGSKRTESVERPFLSVKRNPEWKKKVSPCFDYFCTAIVKGEWLIDAIALCKKEGIALDLSKRKTETRAKYIKRKLRFMPYAGACFRFYFRVSDKIRRMTIKR